jgi:hypothetical protein
MNRIVRGTRFICILLAIFTVSLFSRAQWVPMVTGKDAAARNVESLYATRGGPYLPGDFGVSTYRDKTIFLHILHPTGATLTLPALPARILACASLTGGEASCKQSDSGVKVTLSGNASSIDTIIQMTLASPAAEIKLISIPVSPKSLTGKSPAVSAHIFASPVLGEADKLSSAPITAQLS